MEKLLKLRKVVIKYLGAAILITVVVYPKFPFIRVPGTFVSIRMEDLLIAVSSLLILYLFFDKVVKLASEKIVKLYGLFLFVGFLSFLSSILILKTAEVHIGFLHLLRRFEYFIPFTVSFIAISMDRNNLSFYIRVVMVLVLITFLFGLGQKYFNFPVIVTQNEEYAKGVALRTIPGGHLNATFAGHYDMSTFLVLLAPMIIGLAVLSRGFKSKLIFTSTWLMAVWLIGASGSRISTLSFLVSACVIMILLRKLRYLPIVLLLSLLVFGMSSNLVERYKRLRDVSIPALTLYEKMDGKFNATVYASEVDSALPARRDLPTPMPTPPPVVEDRSTSIRLNVEWPRAIRAFSKNPLLGTGYSSIGLATDNGYLRLLGELGLLGFFSFSLIFVYIAGITLRKVKLPKMSVVERCFTAGYISGLAGVFINAAFIDVFEASKFALTFWFMTGLYVSIVKQEA
jgi:hypothetical protein